MPLASLLMHSHARDIGLNPLKVVQVQPNGLHWCSGVRFRVVRVNLTPLDPRSALATDTRGCGF